MKRLTGLKFGTAPIALGIAMLASAASAQDIAGGSDDSEAAANESIIVTGSRISRPETEGSAPLIASISAETIEQRQFSNVIEALNEVPGFGLSVSSNGGQAGFSVGQNFVNLFGIGSQRTLTLVNGRRFVSSNTASNFGGASSGLQVDLNVIPISLVENIDVLPVKGATTYGSDAIAGTVNIILKDDFEGFEVTGQGGIFEEGDGESYRFGATLGTSFDDGRGNITANFEYVDSKGVRSTARPRTADQLFFTTPEASANSPFSSVLIRDRRIQPLTRGGLPTRGFGFGGALLPFGGGFTNSAGDFVQFGTNGDLVPYDLGGGTGSIVNVSGGDGLNLAETAQISSDLERFTFFSLGHYEVTDDVRVFFEANYAETSAVELANQPVFQSVLFGGDSGSLGVLLSNPFLNNQARSTLLLPGNLSDANGNQVLNFDTDGDGVADDTRFTLQRASLDLLGGDNANFGELELFRIVGGLAGDFGIGDRNFNWNISYAYGRSQSISTSTSLVQENFINAVDAVLDANGNIVCRVTRDGPAAASVSGTVANTPEAVNAVSGCVPLNLFGENQASQEAIDFVTARTLAEAVNTQRIFNANLTGELFDIGQNTVAFNVGYERRLERQRFLPDGFLQEGLGRSVAISPISGGFDTDEFFAELLVPVISPSDDSFIHLLEFDGSIRFIDNSQSGSDEAWTVGARFAPIPDITFRGSYTESVRSPAITELLLPEVNVFSFADDPCDEDFINAGPDPARRAANCAAAGINQPFSSIIEDASQQTRSSGNPNLLNETSKAWTAGVILEPSFIPRLSIAVDWIDIDLTNAVEQIEVEDFLRVCFDSPDFPNVILPDGTNACDTFTRDANGQIIDGLSTFGNAGTFEFAGLQTTVRYNFDLADLLGGNGDLGNIGIVGRYFYTDKSRNVIAGVEEITRGEIGNSKHEANATLTYRNGGLTWSLTGIYISSAVFDNDNIETSQDILGVGDYLQFNTTIRQEINDTLTVRFTVDNLFEEEAPFPSTATNTYNAGILGRRFTVGATARF